VPTYDYKCEDHGYFELIQRVADHATGNCPTCEVSCKQVLTRAPSVPIEALADAGFPGALETSGNRMEKRHRAAGQDHTATAAQREMMSQTSAYE
jgi:putative FmdB family regulatory protein